MPDTSTRKDLTSLKPFRLVKYFSFTSIGVVLITAITLSWLISNYAQKVLLEQSESSALLLAKTLNNQVFLQFVLPIAINVGEIRLSDPNQFRLLDNVVRNTISGLNVDSVKIFDSSKNIISYSTDIEKVGKEGVGRDEYDKALAGQNSMILNSSGSLLNLLPGSEPITSKLTIYIPFRQEKQAGEEPSKIMGVTQIVQDLSANLEAIIRLQGYIVFSSIMIMGVLFYALRLIVARADQIIEMRADERRRLEEKLHQAERLASLGKMVAAVSHEIKNPLGIVKSTAEILGKRMKDVAPGNEHLAGIIVEEATRLDGIVMEFLDFARPLSPNLSPSSLNDILSKVIRFMEPEFAKHQVELRTELDQNLPLVKADQNLLHRAFLNILVNAVQAMPDGGTLTVGTARPPGRKDAVLCRISDTGIGIIDEKLERIFNPFFTDKTRGTGLGLSIAQNIFESHQGSIEVESEVGKGTTFTITLGRT